LNQVFYPRHATAFPAGAAALAWGYGLALGAQAWQHKFDILGRMD